MKYKIVEVTNRNPSVFKVYKQTSMYFFWDELYNYSWCWADFNSAEKALNEYIAKKNESFSHEVRKVIDA